MIEPKGASLAMDAEGNQLLAFRGCAEDELDGLDPAVPLSRSIVVAERGGQVLLAHNSWRLHWQLPGGRCQPGETTREAAVREFISETGLPAPKLRFVGVVTFKFRPDNRLEYGVVYRAHLAATVDVDAFTLNDEIGELRWWDLVEELPDSADLDLSIAQLALR